MQHHAVGSRVEAVHRTNGGTGRIRAVHAGHRHRAFARFAVVDGDHPAAVDAPGHLVLVLAGSDAGIALDATIDVAEKLHSCHGRSSLRRSDLAESRFWFLHARHRVEAVGRERVHALAQHHWIGALRVLGAQIVTLVPAAEVERTPGHALADAFGDKRLYARSRLGVGGPVHPDPAAVLDAALCGIGRIDFDEHVLLQFGEPLVGASFLAATLVLHQTSGGENERVLLGDTLFDGGLLHVETNVGHAKLPRVGQGRVLGHQLRTRRVDRLAVHRHGIGQAEGIGAGLAIAVVHAAVLHGDALDAARKIDRPGHRIRVGAADALDGGALGLVKIAVPTELLEHTVGELGITVLDFRAEGIGAFGEQVVARLLLHFLAVHDGLGLDHPLDAEAGAEGAAAIHDMQVGIVEGVGPRVLELRRAPAGPRQAVVVALARPVAGPQRHQIEVLLVGHVQLEALGRLPAIARRPATAVDFTQNVLGGGYVVFDLDVLEHLVGEAELHRQAIHDFVIVFGFENRLDDLLAPLQRAVRGRARARHFVAGGNGQQVGVLRAIAHDRPRGGHRVGDHQQFELFDAGGGFRDAGNGVATVAHDHHRLEVVLLGYLFLRQQRGIEPARRRDARRIHHLDGLAVGAGDGVEAAFHPGIVNLPDAAPVLPGALRQAVVQRQRHDIEAEIGGALHVGVAAEDVGAGAELADVAGGEQGNAKGSHVGRADRVLGRTHAPDQRGGFFGGEHLGDAFELCTRHPGHALDLLRRPLFDLLADIVHAVDALLDEVLVLPAVLENVPEHAVDDGNIGA